MQAHQRFTPFGQPIIKDVKEFEKMQPFGSSKAPKNSYFRFKLIVETGNLGISNEKNLLRASI